MAPHGQVQDINALLGRRRLTAIPKDQLKLLNRHDSWAVDLANKPNGLANVPGHVLETVKEAYIARLPSQSKGIGSSNQDAPEEPRQNGFEASDPGSDPPPLSSPARSQMSWSTSPPRPPPLRRPAPQLPLNIAQTPETARDAPSLNGSPSRQAIPSQQTPSKTTWASHGHSSPTILEAVREEETGPPRRPLPALQRAPQFDFASSDNEEEVPEVPASQDLVRSVPINKDITFLQGTSGVSTFPPGQAMNTPPCAQASQSVVPETVLKVVSSHKDAASMKANRRYRIKPATFSDDSPEVVNPRKRLDAPKPYVSIESSNHTSSSLAPSTIPERPVSNPKISLISNSADSDKPAHSSVSVDAVQSTRPDPGQTEPASTNQLLTEKGDGSTETRSRSTTHLARTPTIERREQKTTHHVPIGTPNSVDILGSDILDSYDTFIYFYPEYTESYLGNRDRFVKACVCLEYLQRERGLHEFLYDDFIRTFSHGFLPYVRNAGPGQEPLPAVEWYNIQSGRPVFTKMIVRRKNLLKILKEYPEQVAQARAMIVSNTDSVEEHSRTKSAIVDTSDAMEVDTAQESTPRSHDQHPRLHSEQPPPSIPAPVVSELDFVSSATPSETATPVAGTGHRRTSRYMERLTSSNRPRSKKRTEDHAARWKRHLKQRFSNGAAGTIVSERSEPTPSLP